MTALTMNKWAAAKGRRDLIQSKAGKDAKDQSPATQIL